MLSAPRRPQPGEGSRGGEKMLESGRLQDTMKQARSGELSA